MERCKNTCLEAVNGFIGNRRSYHDRWMVWKSSESLSHQGWGQVHHIVKHRMLPPGLRNTWDTVGKHFWFANGWILFLFTFYSVHTFFCNSLWGHMNSVLPQHIVIYWQNHIFSKWPLRESCLLLVVRLIQSAPMLALLMLTFFSHRASFPPLLLVLFPLTRSHAPPLVLLYYLPVLSSLYFLRTCN